MNVPQSEKASSTTVTAQCCGCVLCANATELAPEQQAHPATSWKHRTVSESTSTNTADLERTTVSM